jgi:hypothetical protein
VSVSEETKSAAAAFDRKTAPLLIVALAVMIAGIYVRVTSDTDPLWAELTTPLFFALLGARSIFRPAPPETRKAGKMVGILLVVASIVLAVLTVNNSLGAS